MPFTGRRPYKCPLGCGATFSTEKRALKHMEKCGRRGKKVNYVKRPKDDE